MHPGLIVAKLVTMVLGFVIAYQAYRGYRRSNSQSMLYLAVGFAIISFGAIVEGILFDVVGLTLHNAGTVATTIVAIGMLTILYALYGRDPQKLED
ncbi:hypothetical protein DVK05_15380 [Halorubrum sp. Atlit-8R]|jgi:hypothetical protein|uniref:Uncharacterized protein n=5 Tax=Halobacteriales TaxID=2235 RepID=A0A7D4CUW4_9EURY|nr:MULTISPECIES: hypothetical protein [Halobacteria]TKX87662.1 hypothetical protein EXE43_01975 [Halorubrum sp. SS5]MBX0324978.1 hypothetical protein [Halomicroarcula rubra]MDS0223259.1 hypothetical protein [Haloarcula terrestris]MDS0261789.1 hypothetical protein [Haloarcula sp. S1CR25-12]MDS0280137.1 hypothetical protein [Halomicroarcula sp. S1AR25-4]